MKIRKGNLYLLHSALLQSDRRLMFVQRVGWLMTLFLCGMSSLRTIRTHPVVWSYLFSFSFRAELRDFNSQLVAHFQCEGEKKRNFHFHSINQTQCDFLQHETRRLVIFSVRGKVEVESCIAPTLEHL